MLITFFFGTVVGALGAVFGVGYLLVRTQRLPDRPVDVAQPVDDAAIVAELAALDVRIEHEEQLERLARLDQSLRPYGLRTMAGRMFQ